MRRKLRRIGTFIAVAAVALMVAVFATLSSIDFNAYRDTIAAEIERATGREVRIAGELKLEIGLRPSLNVADVSLANAAGGSRSHMATVERLEAKVGLWPLLSGDIDIDRLVLVGADILLETDENGLGNWVFAGAAEADAGGAPKPTIPVLDEVSIERSMLTYVDGERRHQVRIDALTAQTGSGDAPLELQFSGAFDGKAVTLAGAVGTLRRLRADRSYPLDVKLRLTGVELAVEGVIARPLQGRGLDLAVTVAVPELAALSALTGVALPKLGPITGSLTLRDQDDGYRLDKINFRFADSDLEGDLRVSFGARPRLSGVLRSNRLALDQLHSPAPREAKDDGRMFPDEPLPIGGLHRFDADLALQAAELSLGQMALRDLALKITLEQGRLSLKPGAAVLADGRLDFAVALDAARSPPRLGFKLALQKADLARLIREASDGDLLRGRLDLKLEGDGRGRSLRAIMAGLNGNANAVVVDGYIARGYIDLLAADLLATLAPGGGGIAGAKVNCFVADLPVAGGLAKTRVLLLDTERMTVVGDGTIDLSSERLNLQLKPKPKDASLLSLATPVNVGGTLADPTVRPDAVGLATGAAGALVGNLLLPGAGLLLPLLSPGSDDKHPCLRAVSAETGKAAAGKDSGGIGGFLKGLGDKIDKTLGVTK